MMLALGKLDRNSKNFLYYYIHDYQESLFDNEYLLTVIWGRNQEKGRYRVYGFGSDEELRAKVKSLLGKKIREGYHVYYSYPNLQKILSDIDISQALREKIGTNRGREVS